MEGQVDIPNIVECIIYILVASDMASYYVPLHMFHLTRILCVWLQIKPH